MASSSYLKKRVECAGDGKCSRQNVLPKSSCAEFVEVGGKGSVLLRSPEAPILTRKSRLLGIEFSDFFVALLNIFILLFSIHRLFQLLLSGSA